MPWREKKDHYSFTEIADRWRLSTHDLGYFAERGLLEVQTWLSDVVVARYVLRKVEGGDVVPVQTGIDCLTGYFVVDANELRKIFRATQNAEVRKFSSPDGQDLYSTPYNNSGPTLNIGALEVTLSERNRFEIDNGLKPRPANTNKTGLASTSVGRPSVKQLILDRHIEREARGEHEKTVTAEARVILQWAQDELGQKRAPAFKTIVNNLRPFYSAQKN